MTARAKDENDWFAFQPDEDFGPSVIDAGDWLDAPAGKHGFLRMDGEHFVFEDGTPCKLWGVNIANKRPACEPEHAERWAAFLAKYGVNAVRFHKFTWHGEGGLGSAEDSTRLIPELWDKMDYFVQELRERGIYQGWSHIYGHRLRPGDRDRVEAYDEIMEADVPWGHLRGSTIGLVNFAPDLQDLSIELTVNMLNHENPCTGLRYADDAGLAYIELQNEDDIFWGHTEVLLERCPTYARMLNGMFSDWLRDKYGGDAELRQAWGEDALEAGESLSERTIRAHASHEWINQRLAAAGDEAGARRALDNARFLYEKQLDFYRRFVDAIRETGYRGAMVGSCWQAGSGIPHYYNLHADYDAGFIDRHNYFGGGARETGPVNTRAMVDRPGSGLLSTGMQQVLGRPFGISEWMSLVPNPWVAEAPPVIAVYGMGLQGWDASFAYANNDAEFSPTVLSPSHGPYTTENPMHMGTYPALARMIYRGDVEEGDLVSVRKVHVPSLEQGELGFSEEVEQAGDVKSFGGEVPPEALAAGKVAVEFTDQPEPTEPPDLTGLWDREAAEVVSNTGQLRWRCAESGYFAVDTPGTQAVVGFAGGERVELSDVVIEPETDFACIFVTSLDGEKPIAEADSVLITAVARGRNTGMEYSDDLSELLSPGEPPVLLQRVRATVTLKGRAEATVRALDHVGRRTDEPVPVQVTESGLTFRLGETDPGTLYYEVSRG
ncbi:MAG: hypothetical protein R6X33_17820 [Candidatus Brocadiia bacterium]